MQTKNHSLTVICNQLVWKPGLTSSFESVLPTPPLGVPLKSLGRFSHCRQQTRRKLYLYFPNIFWKFFMVFFVSEHIKTLFTIFKLCMLQIKMKLPLYDYLCCCSWWGQCPTTAKVCCLSAIQRCTVINILETKVSWREESLGVSVTLGHWVWRVSAALQQRCLAAASLRVLGSSTSGSLKITRANNKQTEAITGRGEERV